MKVERAKKNLNDPPKHPAPGHGYGYNRVPGDSGPPKPQTDVSKLGLSRVLVKSTVEGNSANPFDKSRGTLSNEELLWLDLTLEDMTEDADDTASQYFYGFGSRKLTKEALDKARRDGVPLS